MKTIARNNRNFTLAAVAAVCLAAVTVGAHADEVVALGREVHMRRAAWLIEDLQPIQRASRGRS